MAVDQALVRARHEQASLYRGFDQRDQANAKTIVQDDSYHAKCGATFCLPHQATTDALCDRTTRTIRGMDKICQMIRARGMIPGLSTHMPESVTYADESGLDVETYIQIYNSMGFLMQVEVDWVATGGHTVPDLLKRVDKDVIAKKPTIVVIQIGCNDARRIPKDRFRAGLEELPTCRYPSGHEPHTESMFAPKGTHWTTVGSPSLQIFASVVTPVVT